MKPNVGGTDRVVRILVGIVLLAAGLFHAVVGGWAIAAYVIAAIFLITGVSRVCPAWSILGINTFPVRPAHQK